jgi:hypothetical protein
MPTGLWRLSGRDRLAAGVGADEAGDLVARSNLPVDRLTTAATGGRRAAPANSAVLAPSEAPTKAIRLAPWARRAATAPATSSTTRLLASSARGQADLPWQRRSMASACSPACSDRRRRPEAAQVGRVLVQEHDAGRAAADQHPVELGAVLAPARSHPLS